MLDIFEILGPIMVGPSSSHTAGAVRIGRMARTLLGEPPVKADILVFPGLESLLTGQVVLAEDAAQRAAGKKDRPGALLAADTGFLPKVQSGAGKLDRIAHTAATGEKAAVNAAVSWTEGTRV